MLDDEKCLDDILRDIDFDDPFFDLDLVEIPKINFDPKTPIQKINNDFKKFKKHFKVGHLNSRSLNKNFIELKRVLDNTDFDAFAVSESWLTKNTPKSRYMLEHFNIFRCDRKNTRGGGICIFVRSHYNCRKISLPNQSTSGIDLTEMLWVEISTNKTKIAVGVFYKPPKIPYACFEKVFDSLLHIYSKYQHTILLGDFNINLMTPESLEAKALNNFITEPFDLKQLIETPTRITQTSRTLIDLIFVGNGHEKNVLFSGTTDAPGISDHHFTYVAYNIKKEKAKPKVITCRDFKNFDFNGFNKAAENLNWESIIFVGDLNTKVTILENLINQALDPFAPFKTFTVRKPGGTPWISDEIKEKMDRRDEAKDSFNQTGDQRFYDVFKILKNGVNSMLRKAQVKMFNDEINSKVKSSKEFYKTAKKLNVITDKKCSNSSNCMFTPQELNDCFLLNNNAEIDETFVDEKITELYNNTLPCIHKFSFTAVSELDVIKIVKSIKSNSSGVDDINSYILKLLIGRISGVLTHIINISFEHGVFPDRWKLAIIKPIPKIPFPLKASDYRPISLLPTLSKVIEKVVAFQWVSYLNKYELLDPNQSAYRENHSTTTALLKIVDDILESLEDSEINIMIFLDFSKAFDTVNHRLLLEKLKILGFDDSSCTWIKSYLSNRYQCVKVGDQVSEWKLIRNGVPQGSILGPLLFTILTSDMRKCFHFGNYHEYADDTTEYKNTTVENINDSIQDINQDMRRVGDYCKNNFLRLNEDKCEFLIAGSKHNLSKLNDVILNPIIINGKPIKRVPFAKSLGIRFDEVLSWTKQVNTCIGRAIGKFKEFSNCKRMLNFEAKKNLCETMVLSQFNYADTVYINMNKILQYKIQKIQNMCIRFIFNCKSKKNISMTSLRHKLGWFSMSERRISHGLILMYKIVNKKAPNYLSDLLTFTNEIHNVRTRSANRNAIWIGKDIKTKSRRNAFFFSMSTLYNKLPENIISSKSVSTFKIKLNKLLSENKLAIPDHFH